jgi:hypothetical protein
MKTHASLPAGLFELTTICSSTKGQPSPTTVDPKIEEQEKAAADLKSKLNTTTVDVTVAPKAAPYIINSESYYNGTKGAGSDAPVRCRGFDEYSDGTVVYKDYIITRDAYDANNGC